MAQVCCAAFPTIFSGPDSVANYQPLRVPGTVDTADLLATSDLHCRQLKLVQPLLNNTELARLRASQREDFRVCAVSTTYPLSESSDATKPAPGSRLRAAIEASRPVRQGSTKGCVCLRVLVQAIQSANLEASIKKPGRNPCPAGHIQV